MPLYDSVLKLFGKGGKAAAKIAKAASGDVIKSGATDLAKPYQRTLSQATLPQQVRQAAQAPSVGGTSGMGEGGLFGGQAAVPKTKPIMGTKGNTLKFLKAAGESHEAENAAVAAEQSASDIKDAERNKRIAQWLKEKRDMVNTGMKKGPKELPKPPRDPRDGMTLQKTEGFRPQVPDRLGGKFEPNTGGTGTAVGPYLGGAGTEVGPHTGGAGTEVGPYLGGTGTEVGPHLGGAGTEVGPHTGGWEVVDAGGGGGRRIPRSGPTLEGEFGDGQTVGPLKAHGLGWWGLGAAGVGGLGYMAMNGNGAGGGGTGFPTSLNPTLGQGMTGGGRNITVGPDGNPTTKGSGENTGSGVNTGRSNNSAPTINTANPNYHQFGGFDPKNQHWKSNEGDFGGNEIANEQVRYMNSRGMPSAAQYDRYINNEATNPNSSITRMRGGYYNSDGNWVPVGKTGQQPQAPQASQGYPYQPRDLMPHQQAPANTPTVPEQVKAQASQGYPYQPRDLMPHQQEQQNQENVATNPNKENGFPVGAAVAGGFAAGSIPKAVRSMAGGYTGVTGPILGNGAWNATKALGGEALSWGGFGAINGAFDAASEMYDGRRASYYAGSRSEPSVAQRVGGVAEAFGNGLTGGGYDAVRGAFNPRYAATHNSDPYGTGKFMDNMFTEGQAPRGGFNPEKQFNPYGFNSK